MTPTYTNPALETWTPERQKEINESTPENPVRITPEEEKEMREANKSVFQASVGSGRFLLKAKPGTPAAYALVMSARGASNAAIAHGLEISEDRVKDMLALMY